MATDARYVNARVLDSGNGFANDIQVKNGIGFAIDHGADVLNLSLNFFAANSNGTSAARPDARLGGVRPRDQLRASASATSATGSRHGSGRGPGSAYNGVTVGRTTADFSQVHIDSANAFTPMAG